MDQNPLAQSDCRTFQSIIYIENNEIAWFFACWYEFMNVESWLKNIEVGVVKNECGFCGNRTLKLAISQEGNNEINRYWLCLYKFR